MSDVEQEQNSRDTLIGRAPDFVRTHADTILVMNLGRDFDISFMTLDPRLLRQRLTFEDAEGDIAAQVETERGLSEVARIRLAPAVGLNLAMNLIENLFRADLVDEDALLQHVQSFAQSEQSEGQKDDSAAV